MYWLSQYIEIGNGLLLNRAYIINLASNSQGDRYAVHEMMTLSNLSEMSIQLSN